MPYHNASHAACVTHGVYHLITQRAELADIFGANIDIFSVCLAALVHDLGHTGHNNAFHVASGTPSDYTSTHPHAHALPADTGAPASPRSCIRLHFAGSDLAILYSDQSVLEMHHLANAFQILKAKECDILHSIGDEARKEVRNRVVGMVLATDLAVNFPTINAFKQMVSDKATQLEQFIETSEAAAAVTAAEAPTASMPATAPGRASVARVSSREAVSTPAGERKVNWMRSPTQNLRASILSAQRPSQLDSQPSSESNVSSSSFAPGSGAGRNNRRKSMKLRDQLETMSTAQRWKAGGLQVTAAEEMLILKMVLKVSDIGNVTKGKQYCLAWTNRVVAEFFAQGDLEAKLKLPVTPFMDRNTACVPKQQIGFYNFIARPMFEAVDNFITMQKPLANLGIMHAHWTSQMPPEPEKLASPLPAPKPSAPAAKAVSLNAISAVSSAAAEAE